jgi:DNA-binding SARP family transcriptional activator
MQFRILGPLEVNSPQGPIIIGASRQQVVLAMLLLESGHVVSVDRLVDAVWDQAPPATARDQIQICVSALRKLLQRTGTPSPILTRPPGYVLRVPDAFLDLHIFEDFVRAARKDVEQDRLTEATGRYREALALWRGAPLEGVNSRLIRSAVTRLVETKLAVVEECADLRLRLGHHHALIGELRELVLAHPLRERLRAQLMLALYGDGRQAEALEAYRVGRRILVDELGVEPGDELRTLQRAILAGGLSAELRPPIRVATQAATSSVAHMLPADIPEFIGGAPPVGRLVDLLTTPPSARGSVPVVITTVGRGGVGKTTLNVHVAHAVADEFPDGQLYATLDGSTAHPLRPSEVLERFLRALGVSEAEMPHGLGHRAEVFRSRVAGQRILIVLDDARDEEQLRPLMPGSSTCAVLITSRSRLAGLDCVTVTCDPWDARDSMRLLASLVGEERVYAEPSRVLELVELCGGLPLALRIAGARLAARPHWTIAHLVERMALHESRLDELTHGGQSVRASIRLAYDALDQPARVLVRRLVMLDAVDFAGWVSAPLLDDDLAKTENIMESLVDAHVLDVEHRPGRPARFRFHELVWVFARERLAAEEASEEGRAALHRVVGAWLSLVEQAHERRFGDGIPLLHGDGPRWPLPPYAVGRILTDPSGWYQSERYALVTAIRQASDAGFDELCWDLACTAAGLFGLHGHLDQWRQTHELALAAVRRTKNRRGEAAMLRSIAGLALAQHRTEKAEYLRTEAAAIFAAIGDDEGLAMVSRAPVALRPPGGGGPARALLAAS